jgi:NAD(P)-dependent dehydrogenase (short-subunit alcohol dehydrogenase family)
MTLTGKVVLITGANGGLGTAVTNSFLEAGARVAGVAKKIQNSDFPQPNFVAYPAELGNAGAARAVASAVIEKWERIDALVHLVGAFTGGKSVAETDDEILEQMLEANLRTAFHMFRAVLPQMRKQNHGLILGISANVILPGTMDTPANRAAMPGADPAKWVQPAQVASLLVHLATDLASQISGAVIPVAGSEL